MRTLIAIGLLALTACTDNERARVYGGTSTVHLEKGRKLVNITWKGASNMWYLTKPMTADETPETYEFSESSSWGVWEGKIIVVETR